MVDPNAVWPPTTIAIDAFGQANNAPPSISSLWWLLYNKLFTTSWFAEHSSSLHIQHHQQKKSYYTYNAKFSRLKKRTKIYTKFTIFFIPFVTLHFQLD